MEWQVVQNILGSDIVSEDELEETLKGMMGMNHLERNGTKVRYCNGQVSPPS